MRKVFSSGLAIYIKRTVQTRALNFLIRLKSLCLKIDHYPFDRNPSKKNYTMLVFKFAFEESKCIQRL